MLIVRLSIRLPGSRFDEIFNDLRLVSIALSMLEGGNGDADDKGAITDT
jgi:hypothetical protein